MTNGEKHIEKLLSWYKEAVTEDGVCYLTCDDKNTLAYALKCCKHYEDIKKDIDSWMLREEPGSSGKPNKSIEEKCPCYHCEYFEIKGWSHCKIHEDAYGDSRCNDYRKANQGSNKVNQGLNKSEIPTGSTTKSETLVSLGVYKQVARERDVAIQQLHELGYEFGQKIEPTTKNDSGVDYISREQALRELKESAEHHANDRREEVLLRRDRDIIRALPSVTPQEPRKGHWDIKDNMWWVCSACGCQTRMMKKYNVPRFCPACGAKMEEVRNERNEYGRYAKNYQ